MDTRDPVTGRIVIEGEHLKAERLAANRGCAFTPWESFWATIVTLAVFLAVVAAL